MPYSNLTTGPYRSCYYFHPISILFFFFSNHLGPWWKTALACFPIWVGSRWVSMLMRCFVELCSIFCIWSLLMWWHHKTNFSGYVLICSKKNDTYCCSSVDGFSFREISKHQSSALGKFISLCAKNTRSPELNAGFMKKHFTKRSLSFLAGYARQYQSLLKQ